MRKKILKTHRVCAASLICILVGAVLSGCGTAASKSELSTKDVDLRISWWGGDLRHERTQKAIDAFEKKYPNIHVTGEFADWGGYWDKLATSTAGGSSPDVIQLDQLYLASYAERGTLLDLNTLDRLDKKHYDPAILDSGRSKGTLYAMPISSTIASIAVNQTLLDELGLKLPDTNVWTWSGLEKFSLLVNQKSGGTVRGFGLLTGEYSLRIYARQHGEELFAKGKMSISPKVLAGYLEQNKKWTESGVASSAGAFSETSALPVDQSPFATKKQAMMFLPGPQTAALIAATGGAHIIPVKLPTGDANKAAYAYAKPGMYWGVSSQSKHSAEASLLVNFLVNSPTAFKSIGTERGISANPEVRASLISSLTPDDKVAFDYITAMTKHLGKAPEIVPNGASEIDKILQRYLLEVLFGKQSAKEAASGMIDDVQKSIDAAK